MKSTQMHPAMSTENYVDIGEIAELVWSSD